MMMKRESTEKKREIDNFLQGYIRVIIVTIHIYQFVKLMRNKSAGKGLCYLSCLPTPDMTLSRVFKMYVNMHVSWSIYQGLI